MSIRSKTYNTILETVSTAQTMAEIKRLTGLKRCTVSGALNYLRRQKLIYVSEWRWPERGGRPYAVYRLGSETDAPVPKNITFKRRSEEDLESIFVEPREWMKDPVRRDPLIAALYGPPCAA